MYTSKEKVINVHIKDGEVIHFKAFMEGLFYTNIYDPDMIINTTNICVNAYSYLSTMKQNSNFLLVVKLKDRRMFENCSRIFTGQGHQVLRHTYVKY